MKAGKTYQYEAGVHKPEYETSAAFGMMLLNDNLESIIKANDICNRYGLDTISAGATIAFATECYEKGIITDKDTDGVELSWGNHQAIVAMTEKVAKREGFGDVLADGVKKAAEKIGKGSSKYAIHAGGEGVAMHDPKFMPPMAMGSECDAAPGRHTSGANDATYSSIMCIMNCSGMCLLQWLCAPGMDLAKFVSASTGWDYGMKEVFKTGERISNIRQAFAAREGIKPEEFKITGGGGRVLGDPPLKVGPTSNVTVDAEGMRFQFFKAMDWDLKTGRPSLGKLQSLGLDHVAKDLWPS